MKKTLEILLNCIKIPIGFILLGIVILFWLSVLILTTITELITYLELKLTTLIKKCLGEKL